MISIKEAATQRFIERGTLGGIYCHWMLCDAALKAGRGLQSFFDDAKAIAINFTHVQIVQDFIRGLTADSAQEE